MKRYEYNFPAMLSACLLGIAAAGLCVKGFLVTYDESSSAKIVGGDAYNYIIYASRGAVWMGAGIASALLAIAILLGAVYGAIARYLDQWEILWGESAAEKVAEKVTEENMTQQPSI